MDETRSVSSKPVSEATVAIEIVIQVLDPNDKRPSAFRPYPARLRQPNRPSSIHLAVLILTKDEQVSFQRKMARYAQPLRPFHRKPSQTRGKLRADPGS